jgi:hypothetical protein
MRVPKMAKNGIYSSFEILRQFWGAHLFCGRDLAETPCYLISLDTAKTSLSNKPISDRNRQKKNKNHFRPISEQACALRGMLCISSLWIVEKVRSDSSVTRHCYKSSSNSAIFHNARLR